MSKKIFNPQDWLNDDKLAASPKQDTTSLSKSPYLGGVGEVEEITRRIESAAADIAPNYADWRDLGFALADAMGESGRSYYQRLSRFYPTYNQTETDRQFDKCLKAHGHGVSIKTLFYLAKQARISVAVASQQAPLHIPQKQATSKSSIPQNEELGNTEETQIEEQPETKLPTFPKLLFDNLPLLLRNITANANSPEDADLLLLGSLTVFSACLPNIYGVYGGREVFPNLFLFVTAQASAGKGRLSLCRRLVEPIHQMYREISKQEREAYELELSQYIINKGDKNGAEKPKEPPMRMLIIPANNSATGLFQLLKDNEEKGLLFETEGDTLAQTFKSEHGNYSDGFRKAFHHETISYNRRKDREFVELAKPCLSALLSGTPKQITTLIPDAENGLFSRFMFYFMNIRPEWLDVFAGDDGQTLDDCFNHYGLQFFDLFKVLRSQPSPIRFCFTKSQQKEFNAYFSQTQLQYLELCGNDYIGTVRRLGLITFRLAMILSSLRIMDNGNANTPLVCEDTDFQTAMSTVKILVQHAAFVFGKLPTSASPTISANPKMALFEALPKQFERKTYLAIAKRLNIPDKTAEKQIERYIKAELIERVHFGNYNKK